MLCIVVCISHCPPSTVSANSGYPFLLCFLLILLLNTWCYTKVDMRYGPVIDTAAYVFVLLLSHFILKEKITKGKIMGNLIIIAGILIYTL